jgi:hypothetical protein
LIASIPPRISAASPGASRSVFVVSRSRGPSTGCAR